MRNNLILSVFALTLMMQQSFAFFFPQVHPRSYHKGDELDILVGQLISHEVTYPIDFYKLNWCDSVAGHTYDPTLGISANEIHMSESPYDVSYFAGL